MFEHLPKEIMLVRIFDLKKCIWWITPKGKSQWSTVQDAQRAFSFHTKGDETTDSKLDKDNKDYIPVIAFYKLVL